jgi:hypothetical protein
MGDAEIKAGRCGPARCTSPSSHLRLTRTLDGMRLGQHTTGSVKTMGAKSSARLGGECAPGREHARARLGCNFWVPKR